MERHPLPGGVFFTTMERTPKQNHLALAVAGRRSSMIQGREDVVNQRIEKCGSCPFTQALEVIKIGSLEVVSYRCRAKFCTRPLDLKIASPDETCPRSLWPVE